MLSVARIVSLFSEIKKSDHRKSTKNQLFVAIISYSKIVQGECRTSSLLERYAEPQPILFKDTANERHENLFSDDRVHPILFKDTEYSLDNPTDNHECELYDTYQYVTAKHYYQESAQK